MNHQLLRPPRPQAELDRDMFRGALEQLVAAGEAVEDLVDVTTMPNTARKHREAMSRARRALGRPS